MSGEKTQGKNDHYHLIWGILIFYLVIRLWDHTPWVEESRKLKSLKVELAAYDIRTGVLGVRLKNNSMYDMKDVELNCRLSGSSGTKLETHNIILFESLNGGTTIESGEKIDASSIQVANVECDVDDATVLKTVYGGQEYDPKVDPLPSRPTAN